MKRLLNLLVLFLGGLLTTYAASPFDNPDTLVVSRDI